MTKVGIVLVEMNRNRIPPNMTGDVLFTKGENVERIIPLQPSPHRQIRGAVSPHPTFGRGGRSKDRSIPLRLLQSNASDNIGGIFSAHIDVEVFFANDGPSHDLKF